MLLLIFSLADKIYLRVFLSLEDTGDIPEQAFYLLYGLLVKQLFKLPIAVIGIVPLRAAGVVFVEIGIRIIDAHAR